LALRARRESPHDRREHGAAEWAIPFLQNQAVDIFQPDIINSGGITGVKMIADLAARYRHPDRAAQRERFDVECGVAAVGGGGVQLPADRVRARRRPFQWATKNPIVIKNGYMKVSTERAWAVGSEMQAYLTGQQAGKRALVGPALACFSCPDLRALSRRPTRTGMGGLGTYAVKSDVPG